MRMVFMTKAAIALMFASTVSHVPVIETRRMEEFTLVQKREAVPIDPFKPARSGRSGVAAARRSAKARRRAHK